MGWSSTPMTSRRSPPPSVKVVGDPVRCKKLGRNARAFAERTFDIESISTRFEDILEHAAAGTHHPSIVP